ncbi:MAG: FAD-dependent oxidoreductase, partial [Geminicoccaceae bacterium]|nr:FAD-dependent oxidoreductase [Geminicoccaceae bacterium]
MDIRVPDIGDFKDVEIIEVHVREGDEIAAEDILITLESDKASMEVPASDGGKVTSVKVKVGDKVSQGSVICVVEGGSVARTPASDGGKAGAAAPSQPAPGAAPVSGKAGQHAEILVLGAGPGGYTAAFRAADLGRKVVLVERWDTLGGVCLNV